MSDENKQNQTQQPQQPAPKEQQKPNLNPWSCQSRIKAKL